MARNLMNDIREAQRQLLIMCDYELHGEEWRNEATGEVLNADIVMLALDEFIESHTWSRDSECGRLYFLKEPDDEFEEDELVLIDE